MDGSLEWNGLLDTQPICTLSIEWRCSKLSNRRTVYAYTVYALALMSRIFKLNKNGK